MLCWQLHVQTPPPSLRSPSLTATSPTSTNTARRVRGYTMLGRGSRWLIVLSSITSKSSTRLPRFWITPSPRRGVGLCLLLPKTPPRQCYLGGGMISACNVTGKWPHYDEMLEQACHSYTTVKEVGTQTYRNVFCYICNSDDPVLFSRCKKTPSRPVSFSALLDFSSALYGSGHDPSSKCTEGQLYDGQRDSCRDILCSQGKQLLNQTCVPIFGSAKGLGYELYFDMESADELALSGPKDLLHSLPARLKDYFPYTLGMLIAFHDFVVAFNTTAVQGLCSQSSSRLSIYATFLTTKHIDPKVFESMLLDLRSTNFTLPTETRNISFHTMPNENARLISRTHKGRVHKHTSCVISVSMSNPYQSDDPEVETEPDSSDPFSTDLVLIRVSNLLPCPQIQLEKDEYVEGDSAIQLDWREEVLYQGDFEEDDSGLVKICLEHFKPDALLVAQTDSQASEAEVIVSIVCTVLSLVCLLLTFITYCLFKTLRSTPGKNNMNLTVTLFAAQLLYLVGSGKSDTKGLCEAMGIFIHYLWLSVFSAMGVCSFHMFRVFTTLRNREDSSERRRKFLQYCVFIYGVPAILVVATLVVHIIISEGASIGYGGSRCYLSSGAATGIAFGIPVAVTVLVNLVFFILTIKPIRNRPKVDKSKQDEHHVLVYIKLSSLTGITWILGFVAFGVQVQALRYLFIVVNASQGVFIFISFVCNCRVVRLYSECCCHSKKGTTKATNAASSSTSTSKAFTISKTETKLTDIKDSKS
ncbi:uncharacterized protein LOC124280058 [Haliotis rubra]|uniref:uncharacterized protein LOC124280058 n=1 Tax=Haliotis rubra TaxID=36100 RepID=UPI001EE5BA64|nr:uncharacterized protein LOC124280058 [Haliotis rubra]